MTLVRLENGQPILEDGKIGVEDACCCGGGQCCQTFSNCTVTLRITYTEGSELPPEDVTCPLPGDHDGVLSGALAAGVRIDESCNLVAIVAEELLRPDDFEICAATTRRSYGQYLCDDCCQQLNNDGEDWVQGCTLGAAGEIVREYDNCEGFEDLSLVESVEILSIECEDLGDCNPLP